MTDPVTPPTTRATDENPSAVFAGGWARLDPAGRGVFAGGGVLVVTALIGVAVGAWRLDGLGLVLLLSGVVAAAVSWFAASAAYRWPVAPGWLEVSGGLLALSLAVLNVLEMLFDLDQIESWGGPIGVLASLVALVAAGAVLVAAARRARVGATAGWVTPRPVLLASVGAALVLVGVALQVSIGLLNLSSTLAYGAATALLGLLVLRASTDPGGIRLPFPAAWLAVAFGVASVLLVLTLIGPYQRQSQLLDATDWLFLVVQGAGAVLLLVAALLAADTVNLVRARLNRS